jgi:hypothetical protein
MIRVFICQYAELAAELTQLRVAYSHNTASAVVEPERVLLSVELYQALAATAAEQEEELVAIVARSCARSNASGGGGGGGSDGGDSDGGDGGDSGDSGSGDSGGGGGGGDGGGGDSGVVYQFLVEDAAGPEGHFVLDVDVKHGGCSINTALWYR